MSQQVTLDPIADVTSTGNRFLQGGATAAAVLADDDDATYLQLWHDTSAQQVVQMAPMVAGIIQSVELHWRVSDLIYNGDQQSRAGVRIGGTDYMSAPATGTTTIVDRSESWSTDPSTGLPWTRSGLDAARWVFEEWASTTGSPPDVDSVAFRKAYLLVVYLPVSSDLARVRDRGSRELELRRKARRYVDLALPAAQGLALRPLDRVAVEHWAGRGPDGQPYGPRDWQRFQGLVRSLRIQPEASAGEVVVKVEDWRRRALLLYDGGATRLTPGAIANGVPRIMRGNALTFARGSVAYTPDPASGLISEAQIDEELLTADAAGPWQIHEGAATNYALDASNSRGQAASTGWTTRTSIGDGTTPFWDPDLSAQTFLFNAPTSLLEQTMASLPQHVCVSIDHLDSGADAIRWSAQRASDSLWFRASDSSWQATEQTNTATASGATTWRRSHWHLDLGGTTNLLLKVKGPSSGQTEVGHVQVEAGRYPTSRILTESATVTRAAASREYAWTTATRLLLAAQGGESIAVHTNWSAAEVPSGRRTLLWLEHDANNSLWWGWTATYGLTLEVQVAGTTYRASKAWSPVAGTMYRVGTQRCSSRGELGLTPYAINVALDGELGTSAVPAAAMTEAASGTLEAFSAAGADHWDGGWRELRTVQYVPTAGELGRGLR